MTSDSPTLQHIHRSIGGHHWDGFRGLLPRRLIAQNCREPMSVQTMSRVMFRTQCSAQYRFHLDNEGVGVVTPWRGVLNIVLLDWRCTDSVITDGAHANHLSTIKPH